jgi:hypothetical protein
MGRKLVIALQGLQIAMFLTGRILDDLTWYDVGVTNEVEVFEGISVVVMILCVLIQIYRKHTVPGMWKILFVRSQFKFIIVWALTITISILFFNIFGCLRHLPPEEETYFYINYTGCCINVAQIFLTILNYSLICNTRAERAELVVYELVLFGEIIYEGNLILIFIRGLAEKPKDYSILFISILIANQVLIMDLIFRAAYEDREREQEAEKEHLLKYKIRKVRNTVDPLAVNIELTTAFHSDR